MSKDLTVAEIKEELDALGIEYPSKAKKKELLEILESETVKSMEEVEEEIKPESYIVLHDWKDLQDNGFIYIKDDFYPRKENKNVTEERIEQLTTKNNRIGEVLIKERE